MKIENVTALDMFDVMLQKLKAVSDALPEPDMSLFDALPEPDMNVFDAMPEQDISWLTAYEAEHSMAETLAAFPSASEVMISDVDFEELNRLIGPESWAW